MLEQRRRSWRRLIEEAKSIAEDLASELAARGVRVERILLFGSRARGDYAEWSDMDIVIVSSSWAGVPYTERLSMIYRIWRWSMDPNPLPLTPEELEGRLETSVALRDASKYWITLYQAQD